MQIDETERRRISIDFAFCLSTDGNLCGDSSGHPVGAAGHNIPLAEWFTRWHRWLTRLFNVCGGVYGRIEGNIAYKGDAGFIIFNRTFFIK